MEELLLLKLLLTKDSYIKYNKYLNSINLEVELKNILNTITSYYEEYPDATYITLDELKTYFYLQYPLYKGKEAYDIIFNNILMLQIDNEDLVRKSIINLIERYYTSDIVETLTQVLSGTQYGLLPSIQNKLDEYTKVTDTAQENKSPFIESTLLDLLVQEVTTPGLKWELECLQHDIGDLRGGSLGHVYARPDTGKTSFLADSAKAFAKQLKPGEIIAWFNNEEKGTKVKLRLYSSMLGKTKEEIATDPIKCEEEFIALGGDKIKIYDNAIINIWDIEKVLKEYNCRVIIIDQGDKVKFRGAKEMATHERLKILYGMFRELAKEYDCDIITAGQASSDAEGKMWLQLDMMDNSKTGKPGELDYAIGIGFNLQEGKENIRYIHLSKNKMKNGVHGKYIVRFDALRARYLNLEQTGVK